MAIDCQKCGQTTLPPFQSEEFSIRCKHCHTPMSFIGSKPKSYNFATTIQPILPLQIGQKGTLQGKNYQIVAWAIYQGVYPDNEWSWNEWLLMDSNNHFKWLSFSMEEGFLLFDELENYSLNFKSVKDIPTPEGILPIIDKITAELKNFDGCLPWATHDFHTYNYYTSIINKTYYSLEVLNNEATLFRGVSINVQEIEEGFNTQKLHSFLPLNQKIGYFINQFFK